jgi:hypothetical protein
MRRQITSTLICTSLCFAIASSCCVLLAQQDNQEETVGIAYELTLHKRLEAVCSDEKAAAGKLHVKLEKEDNSFAWGNEGIEVKRDGFTFYLRFKASRRNKKGVVERALAVGFGGRDENKDAQVTWAEKVFIATKWEDMPIMDVSGNPYRDGTYTVSPQMRVRALK